MRTRHAVLLWGAVAALVLATLDADAGKLTFKYKNRSGDEFDITSVEDLDKIFFTPEGLNTDVHSYKILKKYLEDIAEQKARAEGELSGDMKVLVDANGGGSYYSNDDKYIHMSGDDWNQAVYIMGHELSHAIMHDDYGRNPPQNYGTDGKHSRFEITDESTAWLEGYAIYHGYTGPGQERPDLGCAGQGDFTQLNDEMGTGWVNWKDVNDQGKMWACEGLNAMILRDMARNIPNGGARIEEVMGSTFQGSLKDFLKDWVKKYPDDANSIAKIADAYTNYTMTEAQLKDVVGDVPYLKEKDACKAKYKDKDPCKSVEEMFKPPAGGGGGEAPPPGGGLPGPGGGGGAGNVPTLKPFR